MILIPLSRIVPNLCLQFLGLGKKLLDLREGKGKKIIRNFLGYVLHLILLG